MGLVGNGPVYGAVDRLVGETGDSLVSSTSLSIAEWPVLHKSTAFCVFSICEIFSTNPLLAKRSLA